MKIFNSCILTAAALLSAGIFLEANAQQRMLVDGIAAVVGKEVILDSEIEGAFMQMKMRGATIDESAKCDILEGIMVEKLMAHQAEIDSLEVQDRMVVAQVDQYIEQLKAESGVSMAQILDFYKKPDEISLRQDLFKIIKSQKQAEEMRNKITKDIDATPEEVRQYYNSIPADELPFFETEFELGRLVMKPKISPEQRTEIIDKLKQIKQDVENGEEFKIKALVYSEDMGSSANGGTIEGVKRGMMVKEFEAAAFSLEEGRISDPVETDFGFHIIRVNKRRGEIIDLQHILIRPKYTVEEMMLTERVLDSIITKINRQELTFEKSVREYSTDEATRLNNGLMMNPNTGETVFSVEQMDPQMYNAIAHLQQGQISSPVYIEDRDGGKYSIFFVRKRIEPHRADLLNDYNRLKTLAKNNMQEQKINDWITKKIKDTYVRLSDVWSECPFKANWKQGNRKFY